MKKWIKRILTLTPLLAIPVITTPLLVSCSNNNMKNQTYTYSNQLIATYGTKEYELKEQVYTIKKQDAIGLQIGWKDTSKDFKLNLTIIKGSNTETNQVSFIAISENTDLGIYVFKSEGPLLNNMVVINLIGE